MRILVLTLISFSVFCQNDIKVSSGKIYHFESFTSKYVEPRNIDVWVPENYEKKKDLAVVYMFDGQLLFDSTNTWNHQEWMVDEIASKLISEKTIKDFIVVGIWNVGSNRHAEYFPQKPFEKIKDTAWVNIQARKANIGKANFKPYSDLFLKFLVEEIKPKIDKEFKTSTKPKDTYVMGSSMGGLISMYALCEYPKVFGGAACLSTHWIGFFNDEKNPIPDTFVQYLDENLPNDRKHKIYFDHGTETLDAYYGPTQKRVDQLLKAKKIKHLSLVFEGENHSEKAWQKRLYIPLKFILKK